MPFGGRRTLTQLALDEQRQDPTGTGELYAVVDDIASACKVIGNAVSRGGRACDGFEHETGGRTLVSLANEVMVRASRRSGRVAAVASEDAAGVETVSTDPGAAGGGWLVAFDPLNGSANLDVNFMVGTIFSVRRAPGDGGEPDPGDFLRPGTEQVAAGFALYGSSTRLVVTTGRGVHGFTLDRDVGEFLLTHPDMRIPDDTATFAINASNERFWQPPVKRYVDECLQGAGGPRGKDFGMRWVASLVAETYRILVRGGVLLYPADGRVRDQGDRLGLPYEAAPVAFIVEQAGGAATTGRERVMAVAPRGLHERVPLVVGSRHEVERIERYHREYAEGLATEPGDFPLFHARSLFRT